MSATAATLGHALRSMRRRITRGRVPQVSDVDPCEFAADVQRALAVVGDAAARALSDLAALAQPVIEELARSGAMPAALAAIRMHEALLGTPFPSGCHCLCRFVHPDELGICDGEPVIAVRRPPQTGGEVWAPTCAPCAVTYSLRAGTTALATAPMGGERLALRGMTAG